MDALCSDAVSLVCQQLGVPDQVSLSAVSRAMNRAVKKHKDLELMLLLVPTLCDAKRRLVLNKVAAWPHLHLFALEKPQTSLNAWRPNIDATPAATMPFVRILGPDLLVLWPHRLLRVHLDDRLGASIVWSQDLYDHSQRGRPPLRPLDLVLTTSHVYVMVCVSVPWHELRRWEYVLQIWQFGLRDGAPKIFDTLRWSGCEPSACTMIIDDGCVIVLWPRGNIFIIRPETLLPINDVEINPQSKVSLTVRGNTLARACGGRVYEWDKRTGNMLWAFPFVESNYDPVFVLHAGDALVYGIRAPVADKLEVRCVMLHDLYYKRNFDEEDLHWACWHDCSLCSEHRIVACAGNGYVYLAIPHANHTRVVQLSAATGRQAWDAVVHNHRVRHMAADKTYLRVVSDPCIHRFALPQ